MQDIGGFSSELELFKNGSEISTDLPKYPCGPIERFGGDFDQNFLLKFYQISFKVRIQNFGLYWRFSYKSSNEFCFTYFLEYW